MIPNIYTQRSIHTCVIQYTTTRVGSFEPNSVLAKIIVYRIERRKTKKNVLRNQITRSITRSTKWYIACMMIKNVINHNIGASGSECITFSISNNSWHSVLSSLLLQCSTSLSLSESVVCAVYKTIMFGGIRAWPVYYIHHKYNYIIIYIRESVTRKVSMPARFYNS